MKRTGHRHRRGTARHTPTPGPYDHLAALVRQKRAQAVTGNQGPGTGDHQKGSPAMPIKPRHALDEPRLAAAIAAVIEEHARSVQIHTDWSGYDPCDVFTAVEDEFLEYRQAFKEGITSGRHSKANEAKQLAVTAIKAHIYHIHMDDNRHPLTVDTAAGGD